MINRHMIGLNTRLAVVSLVILFLIGCSDTTTEVSTEEADENEISSEAEVENEPTEEEVDKPVDPVQEANLKRWESYEKEGEECSAIEDFVERGDCFQEVNKNYLIWPKDESKRAFYFPMQVDPVYDDVLFFSIDESDNLSDVQKGNYYDGYEDPHNIEDNYQRGIDILQHYWYILSNIFPVEGRPHLKHIYWYDTADYTYFAVHRSPENVKDTTFVVSHNLDEYTSEYKNTLIHEFGHILTLSEDQMNIDAEVFWSDDEALFEQEEASCETLYITWGCVKDSSYLFHYYNEFWQDIFDEHRQIDFNNEDSYREFFFKYEDHFFNSYQGTDIAEDIAESFEFFIMLNSEELEGQTEMKYEKAKFFYQYDDLVELRANILENFYTLSIEDGVFY